MTVATPAGWRKTRLDTVGTVVTGGTPPTNDRSNYGRSYLFVSPADLGAVKYITTTGKMLSKKGFAGSRRVPKGSTLFVCIGSTIGKVGIAAKDLATNQQINSVIPSGSINAEYLYYAATTLSAIVREQAGEQAVPIVNKSQFSSFEVLIPPIDEQGLIVDALADADWMIAVLERLILKKQAIKQGVMQQLLSGETRLPGFTKPWSQITLGAAGVITGSGVDKTSNTGELSVRLLNYMDVYREEFIDGGTATQVVTAAPTKAIACSVRRADVFFTPTSETPDDIARSAVADCDLSGVVYSYHLVRWRPSRAWDPSYLGYAFSTERFRSQVSTLASGSGTRYVISLPGFRSLTVPQPPLEEQQAIGAILRDMSREILLLRRKLDKANSVKQGMMQQLLTGRTRLVPKGVLS